jgi:hypothetical protein
MFWAVSLKQGTTLNLNSLASQGELLHISHINLAPTAPAGPTTLFAQVQGNKTPIATLNKGKKDHRNIDLYFSTSSGVVLSVTGSAELAILGYFEPNEDIPSLTADTQEEVSSEDESSEEEVAVKKPKEDSESEASAEDSEEDSEEQSEEEDSEEEDSEEEDSEEEESDEPEVGQKRPAEEEKAATPQKKVNIENKSTPVAQKTPQQTTPQQTPKATQKTPQQTPKTPQPQIQKTPQQVVKTPQATPQAQPKLSAQKDSSEGKPTFTPKEKKLKGHKGGKK